MAFDLEITTDPVEKRVCITFDFSNEPSVEQIQILGSALKKFELEMGWVEALAFANAIWEAAGKFSDDPNAPQTVELKWDKS